MSDFFLLVGPGVVVCVFFLLRPLVDGAGSWVRDRGRARLLEAQNEAERLRRSGR